jgi:hypothetical protein
MLLMISKKIMKTTSPLGKTIKKHIVPLPEIPLEWKRETRPQEEKIEKMLLQMGFTPMTPEMRSLLIAAGHYGMPSE